MIGKLNGYLAIPHEMMHVVAYRLIGKRCTYRLGDQTVTALEERSLGQRLFCLLFPLLVNGLAVLLLASLWAATYVTARYPLDPLAYFQTAPAWHRALFFGWTFLLAYAVTALWDVVLAARLVAEKLRQQPPQNT
jgi:hypothetical protein